jgi:hypothetical protein
MQPHVEILGQYTAAEALGDDAEGLTARLLRRPGLGKC